MTHQAKHIQLTVQQQKVVDGILSHQGKVALLHGVTGSGKDRGLFNTGGTLFKK